MCGDDDGRFARRAEAVAELSEQPAGHVVRIVVVVATSAPEERRGDAGFEAEGAIVPTVGASGQHDGKAIDDGEERRSAGAELDFIEGVGGDFGVGTEAEARGVRATEEDIAAEAEVEDGLVPELVVDGATGGTDGDAGGCLGCGEGRGRGEGDGKGEGKREGESRSAHGPCIAQPGRRVNVLFHVKRGGVHHPLFTWSAWPHLLMCKVQLTL